MPKEKEIRTHDHNILMCIMKQAGEEGLVFEIKNGKKKESISLSVLIEQINQFAEENNQKLHIVRK